MTCFMSHAGGPFARQVTVRVCTQLKSLRRKVFTAAADQWTDLDISSAHVPNISSVAGEFAKRGVKVLALSSDNAESHRGSAPSCPSTDECMPNPANYCLSVVLCMNDARSNSLNRLPPHRKTQREILGQHLPALSQLHA